MTHRPAGAPSYDDLAARLADAEAALEAVAAGAVDALVSRHGHGAEIIALERADSFFVTLVTEMQEAMASLDSNGTLLYANPRFAELLGLPLSQVLGRTLVELTAKAGRAATQQLLAEAARGPARSTLELLHRDGRLVPVSVSAAPITSERPEVCLVATDLTERIQAEITLRHTEAKLESQQLLRNRAVEFNDDVIQDLVIALIELRGGNTDRLEGRLTATLDRAKDIVDQLLADQALEPGHLRRRATTGE